MDYFVLKLLRNYDQTGNPRSFHYKWLYNVAEFPKDHLIKHNHLWLNENGKMDIKEANKNLFKKFRK